MALRLLAPGQLKVAVMELVGLSLESTKPLVGSLESKSNAPAGGTRLEVNVMLSRWIVMQELGYRRADARGWTQAAVVTERVSRYAGERVTGERKIRRML
jgi:hypothetical protein